MLSSRVAENANSAKFIIVHMYRGHEAPEQPNTYSGTDPVRAVAIDQPTLVTFATCASIGSYAGCINFHRGVYSSGMRAAQNSSVSLPQSAAATRGAIAGPVRISDEPKLPTNFVFSAFAEVELPLYGVL
jgi:hypothetical protein